MPKKTRKMKQRSALRRSELMTPQPQVEEDNGAVEAKPILASRPILSTANRVVTPATYDYSHIYGDLKRIALFAAFFFVVLIALSFVIK